MLIQKNQRLFKNRNFINLFIISAVLLFVSACVFNTKKENLKSESNSPTDSQDNSANVSNTKSSFEREGKKDDKGDFIVQHLDVKDARFNELDQKIKKEK